MIFKTHKILKMKHLFLLLLLVIGTTACKDNTKSTSKTEQQKSSIESSEEASMDPQELKVVLTKTQPSTEAELREAFPKSINGLPIDKEVSIVKQQAYGTYGRDVMELTIYDCAGTNSGMAGLFFTTYTNKAQNDDQTRYTYKKRNGIKTISTYKTDKNQSTIIFLYRNRWYVALKAENMNPDELWNAFDISILKNFKN